MTASTAGAGVDLFVSYAGPDRPWAEWAAWHLEQAGYTVELDVWDWAAGDNAVLRMNDAIANGRRVLALFSPAYVERDRFTVDEWTALMADRPDVRAGRLVPVRVAEVRPQGRFLGQDHPDTLTSAQSLAANLRKLQRYQQAHDLDAQAWTRRRHILGDNHPETLNSAHDLAVDLHRLDRIEESRHLNEDTLSRQRRVLGDDHQDTIGTARSLAVDLRELGQHEEADALEAEFGLPSTRPAQ